MSYIVEVSDWGPFINLIVMPFLFGLIAYFIFNGEHIVRFVYIFMIPTISLLPYLGQSDPAKPGIQFLIYFALISGFCTGALTGIALKEIAHRMKKGAGGI